MSVKLDELKVNILTTANSAIFQGGNTNAPLILKSGASNYREGLRIIPYGNWSDIVLAGNDAVEASGTSANSWFIGNNNGNFYISRNGSNSSSSAILSCVNNVWSWNGTATGNINGNAASATGVKDASNANRIITIRYSGDGAAATDWIPMHDSNGNLVPVSSTNLANKVRDKASGSWDINISGTAATSTYLKCSDTRNAALNPTDLDAATGVRFDFKAKGTINLTATDPYAGVMSFRPYAHNTDWSGGPAHQIAFNSEGLHWRSGGASWDTWSQILDSSNTAAGANANASLSWGSTYTLAKINGTDIKITAMAKPTAADIGAATSGHNHSGTYVPNTTGANDVNTIYNTGIYNITSGSLTNGPRGYGFGQLLVMSYRKHTGNTTTDWATQIYSHLGSGNNGNTLYYRTSNASAWQTWQMAAHADAGTAKGGAKKPIYIDAQGVIQEGTELKNLAYKDSLSASDVGALASNTTVTNVLFTAATDNAEYPILMKNSTGSTTTAASAKFANTSGKGVTINPYSGIISAAGLNISPTAQMKFITSLDNPRQSRRLTEHNTNSYRHWIILLLPYQTATNTGINNYIHGNIHCKKTGGNIYDEIFISANLCYNQLKYHLETYGDGGSTAFTPISCTYNGIKYFALKCYDHDNPWTEIYFDGYCVSSYAGGNNTATKPLTLPYMVNYKGNGTVDGRAAIVNSEVNNSISTTLTDSIVTSATQYDPYMDINGNATTATSAGKWTTARTLTIGNKGQSVDGSGNVSWSLADIGAAPAVTGGYLPLSGGTLTGALNTTNNTWNKIGDDAQLGDINKAGHIGIQGINGNTGIFFTTYNQTTKLTGGAITWDGTKFSITSTTAVDASISGNAATATKLSTNASNTTASFWRGDNTWSSTLAGSITISRASECGLEVINSQTTSPHKGFFGGGSSGNLGIYDRTYNKWIVYSDPSGNAVLNGNANTATTATNLSAAPSITSGGTATVTLSANTAYTLTVGDKSVIFKTPVDNNTATATDNILDGSNSGTAITYAPYTAKQDKLSFDTSTTAPSRTDRLNLNGFLYATKYNVAGSVTLQWNSTDSSLDFVFA